MFFPKLRRRAKWVFLALAIAFAGGFLVFGVGAGGSGIGDYIAELLHRDTVSGPSVEDAEAKLAKNPNDAAAHLELAQAYQARGRIDDAIGEYEQYTGLRPKDTSALQSLAALYGQKVAVAQREADSANAEAQEATLEQQLAPSTSPFAQELARDRVSESVATRAQTRAQTAQTRVQRFARLETSVYERLTLLVEDDPSLYLQLALAAERAQDYASAIAGYKQFLKASPDDPSAQQIRDRIKQLEPFAGTSG